MINLHLKWNLLTFVALLWLVFPAGARTELPPKTPEEGGKSGSIVINSNSLEINNQTNMVTFSGDVTAKKDDLKIQCRKMLLYYHNDASDKTKGDVEVRVDKIIASGDVRITREDGLLAQAENATYYHAQEKVVLIGQPTVRQGDDFVEGSTITLFLKEKRSMVEGSNDKKVRAVISPRTKKR